MKNYDRQDSNKMVQLSLSDMKPHWEHRLFDDVENLLEAKTGHKINTNLLTPKNQANLFQFEVRAALMSMKKLGWAVQDPHGKWIMTEEGLTAFLNGLEIQEQINEERRTKKAQQCATEMRKLLSTYGY